MEIEKQEQQSEEKSEAVQVAENRARRLTWALYTLGGCAAVLAASLALPWMTITVEGTTMMVGSEIIALQGGVVETTGAQAGVTGQMVVCALLALGVWFASVKRWWWAIAGAAMIIMRMGVTIGMPVARGSVSMAEPAIGLQVAQVAWPAMAVMVILVAMQTYFVKAAETTAAGTGTTGVSRPLFEKMFRGVRAAVAEAKK